MLAAPPMRAHRSTIDAEDQILMDPRARIRPVLERQGGEVAVPGQNWQQRAQQFSRSIRRSGARRFSNQVDADNAVTPGLRNEFIGTYMVSYKYLESLLKSFAVQVVGSNKREELYAYPETAPYPALQRRHQGPKIKSFKFVQFRIPNYAWALRIPYHVDDVDDDLTGSLMPMARMGGEHFGTLDERIFFQILTSGTDDELLPTTLTAPDGVALYSATNGAGAARFGVTGGNIVTGTSNPTAQDIRDIYQDVLARWINMQDTQGQPLINPSIIKEGVTIVHGPALTRQVKEAFIQRAVFQDSALHDASAAPSNIILDSGEKVTTYNSPRLGTTSNALYFFLNAAPIKPIVKQTRRELYEIVYTEQTSDSARDTNEIGNQWRMRMGWGLSGATFYTIRATNA